MPSTRTISLLFERFPEARAIPWARILEAPTPVRRLERFGEALGGAEVWIKQDSLASPLYGGNKPRKLEFALGEALAQGARRVMTAGAIGSNHCMATTIHAARLGLKASLLLFPQPVTERVRRQLLAFRFYGADLHRVEGFEQLEARRAEIADALRLAEGAAPYWVPIGGSSPIGTLGFIDGALELAAQAARGEAPDPPRLYVPAGSCGTFAGLALGAKMAGMRMRVVGVHINPRAGAGSVETVLALANGAAGILRQAGCALGGVRLTDADFEILTGYCGEGYAIPTEKGKAAVALLGETEGIPLDNTYSGKALSALIDAARAHPAAGHVSPNDLPEEFQGYFK